MGHLSTQALSNLFSFVSGISNDHKEGLCDVFLKSKQTRLPFHVSRNKALKPFDLVHCDIWGAYFVKSFYGASYFLTVLDDATRCVWVYLMKTKSEASQLVQDFCAMVQTQFDTKVKTIRSDNGSEFVSNPMKTFYKAHRIIHETSCIDTPQQNGRVERNIIIF